ncbi:hypothetical protein [Vibrio harveyi]|uniref:hypothetical protein n=1 Tax=Vibrio harveyi TaxID=669 RepID=UPI000310F075|nr:hypothetical protein [Vibrio harveyi]EKO3860607.1 hypothetical protein [Vibrio harveyi]
MSETSGAILKVVAALTSPQSAVKFISIAIFLLLSGKAIEEFVVTSGSPIEYQKTIVLFLGLGLGAIVGELIIRLISALYLSTVGRYKKKKEQKLKEKDIEERRKALLEHFIITYKNMGKSFQRELWELSKEAIAIWDDPETDSGIHTFLTNGYAKHFSTVNEHCSIYRLHPTLKEYLQINVPKQEQLALSNFQADQSSQMEALLKLLSGECDFENLGLDSEEYIQLCNRHHQLLEYDNYWEDDENGFTNHHAGYDLYVDPYYKEKLESLYEVHFVKIRIPCSKNT